MDLSNISILNALLIGIFGVIVFIYVWLKRKYSYWQRRGVPHLEATSLLYGNSKTVFYDKKQHLSQMYSEIYNKFSDEPYCGFYEFHYPVLMVRDPQLIQTVLIEKFSSFQSPKIFANKTHDELLPYNPFVLRGARWKETKSMLSLGVTQNKIKVLEDIVKTISQDMFKYIDDNADDVEVYGFSTRYASEMVANFGWGIRSNGFSEDSVVKKMFDLIAASSVLSFTLMLFHPFLSETLKLRFYSKELINFLKHITTQAIETIEQTKTNQNTYLQNVLNGREKCRANGKDMTITEITAGMATLYLDGYETTSRFTSLILYCLALYPDEQKKVKEEVLNVKDEITIETVNKLQYMDMFISEVFRLYQLPFMGRICNEKCKLGDLEVENGTFVMIPVDAVHHDPKYYPNPEQFNPENFSEENKANRPKSTFFSFGAGPRICLGMRYATANMKLLLYYILKNYDITPPKDKVIKPLQASAENVLFFFPQDPMHIGFKKTKHD